MSHSFSSAWDKKMTYFVKSEKYKTSPRRWSPVRLTSSPKLSPRHSISSYVERKMSSGHAVMPEDVGKVTSPESTTSEEESETTSTKSITPYDDSQITSLKLKLPGDERKVTSNQTNTSDDDHKKTSRQSSSNSALSMATTTESLTSLECGSGFRRRWEAEREMDRRLNIAKQKHAATTRLRKVNDVHGRLLQGKIRLLRTSFSQVTKELRKETKFLLEEMEGAEEVTPIRLPRIQSATPVDSRSSSGLSNLNGPSSRTGPKASGGRDGVCRACLFDPSNTSSRCKHFPCFLPFTYNSLSVLPKPQSYSVVGNYNQLLERCRDERPPTSLDHRKERGDTWYEVEECDTTESHAPRTSIKEKIRGLQQLVKEMKQRNEKTKPRDWAVNYGAPLPRRVILKPVKTVC
ncbi:uncharacterized protein LOC128207539 isoform X1 [Mya arenaria]|uniref:uncharacterized protein LOC128207539 isoform X1 n=1 Tax=Mya arenaria TaxID=6604 RepID=UPI0022E8EE0B|nr:uncharacterized protein LOC128207539 isoform X1 [Mya arenaria]